MTKAAVRRHVEKIGGVSRTWFEWNSDFGTMKKTLVVEVGFDTDPNSSDFRKSVLDAIENTTKDVLSFETTMVISNLKIVPAARE